MFQENAPSESILQIIKHLDKAEKWWQTSLRSGPLTKAALAEVYSISRLQQKAPKQRQEMIFFLHQGLRFL